MRTTTITTMRATQLFVVNHMKQFIDLFVAFFGFTKNSQVICKFVFYIKI